MPAKKQSSKAKKAQPSKTTLSLDAKTIQKVESILRGGLSTSSTVYTPDSKPLKVKSIGGVNLDAAKVSRFTEHLRSALADAGAISEDDQKQLDSLTKKVK